jgi:hypothetical protein
VKIAELVDLDAYAADLPAGARIWKDDYNNRFMMFYKGRSFVPDQHVCSTANCID